MATRHLYPVESAGWISEQQWKVLLAKLKEHRVDTRDLCARFGVTMVSRLQAENFADALVFIGKSSKETSAC